MTVVLLILCLFQDDPTALVEKLRSESIADRTAAAQTLKKAGKAAVPALEAAAKDRDGEVAAQARQLLRAIEALELLASELRGAYPGVEDRLATSSREWATLLADASTKDFSRAALQRFAARALREAGSAEEMRAVLHALGRRCLHAAVPELLRAVRENRFGLQDEALSLAVDFGRPEAVPVCLELLKGGDSIPRENVFTALERLSSRKTIPVLVPFLTGKHPGDREKAVSILASMDVPDVKPYLLEDLKHASDWMRLHTAGSRVVRCNLQEAVPILLERMPKLSPDDRSTAASFLLALGAKEGLEFVKPLLESEDERFREGAASTLGTYGGRACAGDVAKLLRHPDPGTRTRAIIVLGEMGAVEQLDAIARLAEDGLQPGGDARATNEVRCYALQAIGLLGGRGRLADIEKGLKDPDLLVRGFAAKTLASLGAKEKAPAIAELLAVPLWSTRSLAAAALATLGERERAPAIARLLEDRDVAVRQAAATALHQLGALPPGKEVARALFAGIEPHENIGVAETLCRAGLAEGVPSVLFLCSDIRLRLQEPPTGRMRWVYPKSCTVLNAVREPAAWKRLSTTRVSGKLEGTRRELIDRLAKEAGLAAEWSPDGSWEDDGWMTSRDRIPRADLTLLEALVPLLTTHVLQPQPARYDCIIEGGRMRILRYPDAFDAWEAWWEARPK